MKRRQFLEAAAIALSLPMDELEPSDGEVEMSSAASEDEVEQLERIWSELMDLQTDMDGLAARKVCYVAGALGNAIREVESEHDEA